MTEARGGYPCLWPGCPHREYVPSIAYEHMTRCPHRPEESRK